MAAKYRTIVLHIPNVDSRRVNQAAARRIAIVTGIAAMVRANSMSDVCSRTTTTNCTVNPRKKKKSNLRRAI